MCVIKRILQSENYKNSLEATQLENKINILEKNKSNIGRLRIKQFIRKKKNQKQFIRNNKSILKTQERFRSERHNVFTEEINKIALR